ncbi:MAG TPA: peptide chain release factor N(5)-glutamine methyltransferase [Ktedonobacterales bacterium]|nr:peptide chain release factor N(5)-glutamine methyltransferase [Ktedonobacterales bacterium]
MPTDDPDDPILHEVRAATTWGAALHVASAALARTGASATPELDAAVLLGHLTGARRATLLAYPESALPTEQAAAYAALIERRLAGEPVAYLTGHREFMGLDFLTDSRALIPRPETEHLVEAALVLARARLARGAAPLVADIGTGSGAIAFSVAALEPRLPRLYATDVSDAALALAAENAARLGVAARVTLLAGDLLDPLPEPVDLLLANLPYIAPREAPTLQIDVTRYEPALALYGAEDGRGHFRRFFAAAPAHLLPGAALLLEFGYDQRHALEALVRAHFPQATLRVIGDYAGWDRVLVVETPAAE